MNLEAALSTTSGQVKRNEDIAERLEEVSHILAEQGGNRSRVQACQRAADTLQALGAHET